MGLLETALPARLGRPFRRLLAASWISNLGDGIGLAAGPLLVASLTDDPLPVAVAAALGWAPPLVFGLLAGVLADRLDRRRLLVTADGVRAAVLAGLAATLVTGHATVALVLTAIAVLGTAEVFADNTAVTLMPMLVGRDDLAIGNARLQTGLITFNQLAGPPLGAALFTAGRAWPFAAEAVLLAAGTAIVSRLVLPPHGRGSARGPAGPGPRGPAGPDARAPGGLRHEVAEGVRWMVHHPAVRTLTLIIFIFNITYGAAWSVLVLYARQRLGLHDVGFGLLTTVAAVGGIVATTCYGWITRRASLADLMRIGLVLETLTHLALALTTTAWVALVIFFAFGAHAFVWGTTSTTVRQRAVPAALQGRVAGVYLVGVYGGLVIGSGVGGVLARAHGVTAPFWFAFAGSALFVVLVWRQLGSIAHSDGPAIT